MFIPTANVNSFKVFYMGSDPDVPKPGKCLLELHKDGLNIKKGFKSQGFFKTDQIVSVKIGYNVSDKALSAGKAVAGGLLFGGVGALAGAAMGRKKVEPYITVTYKDSSLEEHELVFITKQAETLKKKLDRLYQL